MSTNALQRHILSEIRSLANSKPIIVSYTLCVSSILCRLFGYILAEPKIDLFDIICVLSVVVAAAALYCSVSAELKLICVYAEIYDRCRWLRW